MIVCNLSEDSSESVIYLSLTCVYFLRLLGPAFQRILAEDTAPWAGNRLIFIGDYSGGLDIRDFCKYDEIRLLEEDEELSLYGLAEDRVMCTSEGYVRAEEYCTDVRDRVDMRQAGALEKRVRERLTPDDLQLFHRFAALAKTS